MKASTELMLAGLGLGIGALVLYKGTGKAVDAVKEGAGAVGNAINPLNSANIFAGSVNKVGAYVSGTPAWSLGGWLASITGADRSDEIDAMLKGKGGANVGAGQSGAQERYARPPIASSASNEGTYLGSLSFEQPGTSFKDLADPYGINPFRFIPRP